MKNFLSILILTYLLSTINSRAADQNLTENLNDSKEILKIGVLVPLSGEFKEIGYSILNAIKLAIYELEDEKIIIYPKDSKANADETYNAAKELENLGVQIVIGPVFYKSLTKLEDINSLTFLSLTNQKLLLPKNTIAFGINIDSQLKTIRNYLNDNGYSKTILLVPKSEFEEEIIESTRQNNYKFQKIYLYDSDPKKITSHIEKITFYQQRKEELERRVKKLEKSDLEKDKRELEILKEKYTLGKVNFDSVVIADFGERLKTVLTSFSFSDVSSEDVIFFTLNQWFDENLFSETSTENLFFPSIDLVNFDRFRKEYFDTFNTIATEISILAYDCVGLIYYYWTNNKLEIKIKDFYAKNTFKGIQGEFSIDKNFVIQNLKIYKISENKFLKINKKN